MSLACPIYVLESSARVPSGQPGNLIVRTLSCERSSGYSGAGRNAVGRYELDGYPLTPLGPQDKLAWRMKLRKVTRRTTTAAAPQQSLDVGARVLRKGKSLIVAA